MRHVLLFAFAASMTAGCYPRYTKMEPANTPAATSHREVIAAPSYTAGPTQETTRTPDVAPSHYHD